MGGGDGMTSLEHIEQGWDRAARQDAFFNILTVHGMTRGQFWEQGRTEISELLEHLGCVRCERALDFGCGVGRLSQALAEHFDQVDGVDISSEMIELARDHSQRSNVMYHHNTTPDLALFADDRFDLVYTTIVLQHMPPALAEGYVREFLRVTRPGGLVVFQIPEGPVYAHPHAWLSMWGAPRSTVESWLAGAELLSVETDQASGPGFTSRRYTVRAPIHADEGTVSNVQ